jgi:phosphatidylserine/phosphatidylglycerophosphate/cardiolipin synthase-like enzyme
VEAVFRERWEDPQPLTRNPLHMLRDLVNHDDTVPGPLPPQLPGPPPCGPHAVQLLRTYPFRRREYNFAPQGERSIARGFIKALRRARSLIYVEDQYLWSRHVAAAFAEALASRPRLRLIAVIPRFPDQDGRLSLPPNLTGRVAALDMLRRAGGDRVGVYGIENEAGTPVYVHAKVCVIDDVWAMVGSGNLNTRSWTHDSELNCAVIDAAGDEREPRDPAGLGDGARGYARGLRLALGREHLGVEQTGSLLDAKAAFEAFAQSARDLDAWHASPRSARGPRPPGRLRGYPVPRLTPWTRAWASVPYRLIYDPDGRPASLRRRGTF